MIITKLNELQRRSTGLCLLHWEKILSSLRGYVKQCWKPNGPNRLTLQTNCKNAYKSKRGHEWQKLKAKKIKTDFIRVNLKNVVEKLFFSVAEN